ncbi:MAG: glycerophosphodiester phosphodiesterase [Chitinophagaceae bacterium]|nr:MAG: glycerophosphodiester phosphodiesterase [Chitinophagaceae bacterium]
MKYLLFILPLFFQQPSKFDSQGHRGARGLMPENTIPGMIKAIDLGVVTLEMDAAITSDGKVILSHDTHYNPVTTTPPAGKTITKANQDSFTIYGMTYAETAKYDVGLKADPAFPKQQHLKAIKPLLSDVIDAAEAHTRAKKLKPVFYNIETKCSPAGDNLKHPAPEAFVELVMGVVNQKKVADRTIIQSFDFRTLKIMHEKYPSVQTAALIMNQKSLAENIKDLGFTPAIYSPYFTLVTPQLISDCHAQKIRIIPWTVNEKGRIDTLKAMGVDGIISDYPDLF